MTSNILVFKNYLRINIGSLDLLEKPDPPSERMRNAAPKIYRALVDVLPKCRDIPKVQIEDLDQIAEKVGCTVLDIESMIQAADPRTPSKAHLCSYPPECFGLNPWGWSTTEKCPDGTEYRFLVAALMQNQKWGVWAIAMEDVKAARDAIELGANEWQHYLNDARAQPLCRFNQEREAKTFLTLLANAASPALECLIVHAILKVLEIRKSFVEANQILALASLGLSPSERVLSMFEDICSDLPN